MITSTKNYTKEKKKDRQNPRTNGKSKAIQTKSHTEAYTYTLTKREKEKIYIYVIAPKVHRLNLGWFVVYSGMPQMQGKSSWLCRFNPLLLRLLGEISLSPLCLHSFWGSALDLAPPLHVGHLRASVPNWEVWVLLPAFSRCSVWVVSTCRCISDIFVGRKVISSLTLLPSWSSSLTLDFKMSS